MIVRVMGEGQWQVDDSLSSHLNELDAATAKAVDAGDKEALQASLEALASAVRDNGEKLADDYLGASDAVIPPSDLSLEEARELLHGEGLVPDIV
jgi:chromosome condensin MukBEF complex kleisin-like MukF subunit